MEKFEIGEVAIVHGLVDWSEENGKEVVIIGELKMRHWEDPKVSKSGHSELYLVRFQHDGDWSMHPKNLRKKRPPSTDEADRIATDLFDRLTLRVPA
jgi:hypothetical protein